MKSRGARWLVAVAMLAAMLIPAGPATAQGGDAPPPQQASTLSGSGETTRSLDQAGVEVFAVHDGHDLDQYLFRSSSPLDFAIDVDRDYGPVDADGHPAPGNALFGRHARLTLRAWDVDESYPGSDVEPEVDRVRVNGVEIDGQLSGADGQWSISTFSVPGSLLKLPTGADPAGRNDFAVLIDTANVGANVWAVEIDWAQLRPITDSGPRPVALLHGVQSGREDGDPPRNDMSDFADYLINNYPPLDGRVINPFLDSATSIEDRSALLQQPLEELLTSIGAPNVNLAAHSSGGLVARRYAWDHRGEINSVVMIAAPNGGNGGADIVCTWVIRCAEDSSWLQLTTDYVQNTFNNVVLDHDEITYIALASVKEGSETDDGIVTLESAEWLSQTNADHPGKHFTRAHYSLEHGVLIDVESPVFEDVLCEPSFYPDADTCPILTGAASTATQAAASPSAINQAVQVVVPAAGSIDVPLDFEGTSWARIMVLFDAGTTGLAGSFAATPLASTEFFAFDALTATPVNPADGPLTLTNSGAAVTATVLVEIATPRVVTTSATPSLAAPNQPVSLSATLAGAQVGDSLQATVIDGQGNEVQTVSLTDLGGGQYDAEIAGLPAGTYSIRTVSTAPTRAALSLLRVGSGGVQFAGGFTEELVGTADGLADALVIRPAISVTTPGRYAVSARLVDGNGATVATAGTDVDLVAGTQAPALSFDGQAIFASGQSGPYRVVDAVIAISDPLALEAEAADLGPTAAYSFTEFAHFPVRFDLAGFDDTAVDTTGDGIFDELRVTGSMDVDASGTYAINAQLRSADHTQVAEFQTVVSLLTGSNSFTLTFDGEQIGAAGLDGPFTVEDLSVYSLTDPNAVGYLVTAHTTAAYTAAQFGATPLDTTPPVSQGGPLNAVYTSNTVAVPYTAADDASGVASVELWVRYRLNEVRAWGSWTLAATATASPITYTFASGDGDYEFYTIAVDGATNREAPPPVADTATRRDAVDDPPDFSLGGGAISQNGYVTLTGNGTAVDDRSNVSVKWRLYGVTGTGSTRRLTNFTMATPSDGSFNSRVEEFSISDTRRDSGYVAYDVEVEVTAGGTKTTRTVRFGIKSVPGCLAAAC